MTDNVVTFKVKNSQDERIKEQQTAMLDVLEHMREEIANGTITEFVAASMTSSGNAQIHVCTLDLPGSIGLYEIGKHILINQEQD
jgi:hypothetical protein